MNKKREAKIVYCHDAHGYYVGEDSDYGQNPPNNSKYKKPELAQGFIPRWPVENPDADDWEQVENHKGETGYVDGRNTEIKDYGPYPEGWSAEYVDPRSPGEIRSSEIKGRLAEIDRETTRPLRAMLAGSGTDADKEKLAILESESADLREELATLEIGE